MNINYINSTLTDDSVRCTFLGNDATGKIRRPVIEFDASDLATMVEIAKEFRSRQRALAEKHRCRAAWITDSGVTE